MRAGLSRSGSSEGWWFRDSSSSIATETASMLSPVGRCGKGGLTVIGTGLVGSPGMGCAAGVDEHQGQVGAQFRASRSRSPRRAAGRSGAGGSGGSPLSRSSAVIAKAPQNSSKRHGTGPTLYISPRHASLRARWRSAADLIVLHHDIEVFDVADLIDALR